MIHLSNRALSSLESTLISLGGLIGAGLFVGSGTAIATVGPTIVVSYLVAGLLLLIMLHLMGRMRRRMPTALFITDFVRAGLGAVAGSIAGWIYWSFWALVATIEALAGANVLVPAGGATGYLVAIGLLLVTVFVGEKVSRSLSELEVAFASIKVAVIVAFMALASFYLWDRHTNLPRLSQRSDAAGALSVVAGIVLTFFSLAGVEVVHAVANSPTCTTQASARAIRLIAIRVFGIYVVSIALIVAVIRAHTVQPGFSPFTLTLGALGHPWAGRWLGVLILISVLTTLNTALAIGTDLYDRLGGDGGSSSRRGVRSCAGRVSSRFLTAAIGLATVIASAHWPSASYAYLVKSASVLLVMVYILFAAAAERLERCPKTVDGGRRWVGRALVASLSGVLLSMAWIPESQGALLGALFLVSLIVLLELVARHRVARSA